MAGSGCVRTLLRRGANPGAVDDMGRNAMHHAALAGGGGDVVAIVDALFGEVQRCSTTPRATSPTRARPGGPIPSLHGTSVDPGAAVSNRRVKSRLVD